MLTNFESVTEKFRDAIDLLQISVANSIEFHSLEVAILEITHDSILELVVSVACDLVQVIFAVEFCLGLWLLLHLVICFYYSIKL